jgi:hypothetical protein
MYKAREPLPIWAGYNQAWAAAFLFGFAIGYFLKKCCNKAKKLVLYVE